MAIKLIKACKELNIGMRTLVSFCEKHGVPVPSDPNYRLSDSTYLLLAREYNTSVAERLEADGVVVESPADVAFDLPVNHGKPWDDEQIVELRRLADEGRLLGEIARILGRTVHSIEMKLISLGYEIYTPGEENSEEPSVADESEDLYADAFDDEEELHAEIEQHEELIDNIKQDEIKPIMDLSEEQMSLAEQVLSLLSEDNGTKLATLAFQHNLDREDTITVLNKLREQRIVRYDRYNNLWFLQDKKERKEPIDFLETRPPKEEDDVEELPVEKTVEQVQEIVTDSIEKLNIFANYQQKSYVAARYWITRNSKESCAYWLMTTEHCNIQADRAIRQAGGHVVYKNSMMGVQLQTTQEGDNFVITPPAGRMDNHVHNTHVMHTREIRIENDPKPYNYRGYLSLEDFMRYLRETQSAYEQTVAAIEQKEQERQNTNLTPIEKGQLTREINKMKETKRELAGQRDDLLLLSNYIREQGSLRYNPVLDQKQSQIKTNYLYDGTTLVIDGGPGTGKTTTMIQRLKYLTDIAAITEDQKDKYGRFKLSASQSEDLIERVKTNRDWVFFSPSQLLQLYLADAMNKDGLTNTKEKVWDWSDFRRMALRDYGFFGVGKSFPFSDCEENGLLIYENAKPEVAFMDFLRNAIIEEIAKLPAIESSNISGVSNNVRSIERELSGIENDSLDGIIRRLFRMRQIQLVNTVDVETELSKIADDLMDKIAEVEELEEGLEDIQLQDDNIEYEKAENENEMHFMLKNWLRMYCYDNIYHTEDKPEEYNEVLAFLGDILKTIDSARFRRIGDSLIYEQYQAYTKGVHKIILRRLPKYYKAFRKHIIEHNNTEEWNVELLAKLIKADKKQLHFQEQALLLLITNNLIRTINRLSPNEPIKHKYITAYNELVRPIIGIDEVTDFSKVEIQTIVSFALQEYHSITMAGDLMQRLTVSGIQDWSILDEIVAPKQVVELRTSYRQSKRMLEVAQQLYEDTIGKSPNYKAHLVENKVPRPLIYTNDSEAKKIRWIEKRIEEVYKAYSGHLPATAIFLNSKEDVTPFVEQMRQSATLQNAGIKIVDGSAGNVTGSKQEIRVYPINVVKGLEFDVVFFHNIDSAGFNDETIKRYIYVGVSRAAFFLGATMTKEMPDISQYFSKQKNWKNFLDDDTTTSQSATPIQIEEQSTINPIDELILKAMPQIPNETSGISDEILLKVAAQYLVNFCEQVQKYENGGRHEIDKPEMKQKRQVAVISDMIAAEAKRELWGNKYPVYKVYFILGIYMSMPLANHSWWEQKFAQGIRDYLEWCTFFHGSARKMDNVLQEIINLNSN